MDPSTIISAKLVFDKIPQRQAIFVELNLFVMSLQFLFIKLEWGATPKPQELLVLSNAY
ncbi:uncharacterized protein AKAW2_10104S [Aspergillus luchuensis]|uniref:Uncharacterized protein n=1 Tax=Aspergillus kawachii TaxID=1069201 RepID=A0A7R7VYE1_ASPKA|nr:uncharacterized protein AKAW2_10104S [Aspergillus luchuensis]BCR93058.1 hypothetical protein AKAW2_10104S [Aspergillus luchuensis]